MTSLSFFVPGAPVPQARPRVARNGGVYEPPKCTEYKFLVREIAKAKMAKMRLPPMQGEITCKIEFHMPIPASWPKYRKETAKGSPHISRPDIDNLQKAVLDALNGIVYADDGQVFSVEICKRYSDSPGTVILIRGKDIL